MASEFLVVAERVLQNTGHSMTAKEIVSFAIDEGWFSNNIAGLTPHQTLKAKLSVDIRRMGDASRFVRTAPGRFSLRSLVVSQDDVYKAPAYAKPPSRERVLAIPIELFRNIVGFQGLSRSWKALHNRLLKQRNCRFLDRMVAEEHDGFKQVLTYVVVTRRGSVLCYKRGNYNRVESFLRGSRCVGFGGHVSEADSRPLFPSPDFGVSECVIRELREELSLPQRDVLRLTRGQGLQCIGALNDDSSAVGRRHFAFVFQYEVSTDPYWRDPSRGEKSIAQLQWLNMRSLPILISEFEYWSQLVLREYFEHLVAIESSYKILRQSPFKAPHLLCLVGEVGSGKSTTTKVLKKSYGYDEVNTGQILARLMNVPPVSETTRVEFQELAWQFISAPNGPEFLAQAIADRVSQLGSGRILVDGLRQPATLEHLRRLVARRRLALLYVFTPPDIAYEFYKNRDKQDASFDDYLAVRNAEVEREVPGMIALADGVVYNWTGHAFHVATVHAMCKEMGIERV